MTTRALDTSTKDSGRKPRAPWTTRAAPAVTATITPCRDGQLVRRGYAPSALGSFLPFFTSGHSVQLAARDLLAVLAARTRLPGAGVSRSACSRRHCRRASRQRWRQPTVSDTMRTGRYRKPGQRAAELHKRWWAILGSNE